MRSLFAKIFICILFIYQISRGLGFVLLYLLNVPLPPPKRPAPEMLQFMLPYYAQAARDALERGGEPALAHFVKEQQKATSLRMHFGAAPANGCAKAGSSEPLASGQTVAQPIALHDGTAYCLTARLDPVFVPGPLLVTVALLSVELACCTVVSFFLARYLVRPLRHLHHAAVAFADGDLSARSPDVKPGRRDETAALVRAFNHMAEQISALIQAQQRFIADVSHEIKSPLARLSLAVGLARRSAGPEAYVHFARLEREIERASSLVRELQVLSSLQGASSLPEREVINLADVITAAIDNVTFEWQGRPHKMRLAAPDAPVCALGDPAVLQRAVENLLRNALFYAPEDTDVEITVGSHDGIANIEVRDHGPGVPEAALPYLFEPFYRVDASRTRNTGGIGVGLAIFARAIFLHGGTAKATNAEPSGLRICIDLPAIAAEAT